MLVVKNITNCELKKKYIVCYACNIVNDVYKEGTLLQIIGQKNVNINLREKTRNSQI